MFLKNELQSNTIYKLKYGKIYTFDDMIEIKRKPPITEARTKRALTQIGFQILYNQKFLFL